MSGFELIYSFVIGIASGIVSSVLVTAFYRKMDGEKERQNYFTNLRMYISKLISIESSNISALSDFFCSNELPKTFKWIHLKKDEWKTVTETYEEVMNLNELIYQYILEELELVEKSTVQQDTDILKRKYLPQICFARAKIIAASIEMQSLGNMTLKRIIKINAR